MFSVLDTVSIIIPAYRDEDALQNLMHDLQYLDNEIIVSSEGSRARSLNAGARKAKGSFLWFLHADSRITADNLILLKHALKSSPFRLHYFDLAFDPPGLTVINACGANWRSRLFGTPFGDQGLCISKEIFETLGGYPEDVSYGEDLMFVWKARQHGIKLNRIPSKLLTSARKYKLHGWLRLTLLYQWRWIRMSIPEAFKIIGSKS